ncbi:hypothetical protein DFS34DRAFT_307490 [Phlyctochytrium arcticum]|nr:hypothetical protein DFS34DRAFT_307490 [Phlyctochytrium arcticum]
MNLWHLILLLACTLSYVLAQGGTPFDAPLPDIPWKLDPRLNGTEELTEEMRCDAVLSWCHTNFISGFGNGTYPSEEFDTRIRTYADCRCHQWSRCALIRHQLSSIVEKKVMRACHFGAYNNALMVNGRLALWTSIKGVAEDPNVVPSVGGISLLPYPLKNAQGKLDSGNASEPLYNLAEMKSAGTMNFMQSTALLTAGLVMAVACLSV